jgi:hypothetical protein
MSVSAASSDTSFTARDSENNAAVRLLETTDEDNTAPEIILTSIPPLSQAAQIEMKNGVRHSPFCCIIYLGRRYTTKHGGVSRRLPDINHHSPWKTVMR